MPFFAWMPCASSTSSSKGWRCASTFAPCTTCCLLASSMPCASTAGCKDSSAACSTSCRPAPLRPCWLGGKPSLSTSCCMPSRMASLSGMLAAGRLRRARRVRSRLRRARRGLGLAGPPVVVAVDTNASAAAAAAARAAAAASAARSHTSRATNSGTSTPEADKAALVARTVAQEPGERRGTKGRPTTCWRGDTRAGPRPGADPWRPAY